MAVLNANSNPAYIAIQAFLGTSDQSHETAIDFETPSTTTGASMTKATVIIPASGSTTVNLATIFANCPSPVFFGVFDITTTPGQNFGVSFGGPVALVAPLSFWGYACDGSVLPTSLTLTNPNTTAGTVRIVCITN